MSVRITMIGTGYVGLVAGACFAEIGHDVICVDKDQRKIDMLLAGQIPIYEPGLDEIVERNVAAGRLRFSLDLAESTKGRDAVFIAVGTPSEPVTGRADLKYVMAATEEVAQAVDQFTVLVTKSTVPVGTTRKVEALARATVRAPARIAVASNPEFLREGAAVRDCMEPDRVVIGTTESDALDMMRRIYAPLITGSSQLVATGLETAELIKYAANGFLAVKVSFINEMADLCERVGANVDEVARGIGLDNRIGAAFLKTGPGWGGSCLPKDTRAMHMTAQDAGVPLRIIDAAIQANTARKQSMAQRIIDACGGSVAGKRIGILGITFKGQTDDMRESPSLDILPLLVKAGADVAAYDPSNPHDAAQLLPHVSMVPSAEAAARDADALVVLTDWKMFKTLNLRALSGVMREPVLVDLRNLFAPTTVLASGFSTYHGLGMATENASPPASPLSLVVNNGR